MKAFISIMIWISWGAIIIGLIQALIVISISALTHEYILSPPWGLVTAALGLFLMVFFWVLDWSNL